MTLPHAGGSRRWPVGAMAALSLFAVYALTLAPDVTFWDAGEFMAAAHSLGIPHPPGTPLFILLLNAWTKLVPIAFAASTNLFSAAATALAAGITARLTHRATGEPAAALAAALAAGGMASVWLNATETEVYAVSLALGMLMLCAGERAGRDEGRSARGWLLLTAYLIALAVPLHLSALVAAPAAIALASMTAVRVEWRRALMLAGVLVLAMGVGRMSAWIGIAGALVIVASSRGRDSDTNPVAILPVVALALSALAFLYVRARFDPAINQGDSETLRGLADMVARRQYDVAPMWPREAPAWIQIGNLGQYADWQVALSLGPTVMPSVLRSAFTILFLTLAWQGSVVHWRADRRSWTAFLLLLLCGSFGVLAYLNLHAGPSIGYGILPADAVREARERDYFFVFAFWVWGVWAGVGAVAVAQRLSRPAWAGVLIACLPIVLNWRAVTRRAEPERSLPRALADAMLESMPPRGVLFVMGDNDSYPLWYAQQAHGARSDVTVVTVPLLPTDWYRGQIRRRFNLLDSASAARFDGSLATAARIAEGARANGRPVAVSMSMTPAERARLGSSWTASGVVYVEGSRFSALGTRPPHANAESRGPRAESIDTLAMRRMADRVARTLGSKAPRPSLDPVPRYFRRMLDCPAQLLETARDGDARRLDSACNYR